MYTQQTQAKTLTESTDFDAGLRQYMLGIYNYMALGLGLTGVLAWIIARTGVAQIIHTSTPLSLLVAFSPLALVFFLSARLSRMSLAATQMTFWAYCALMGLSLSFVFLAYTGADVTRAFFASAATFAGLSLYGYTTRRNLSGMGSFMFMGLIGIIIAGLINLFLASSALAFAINVIAVIVFAGLTAYDTQRLRDLYSESYDTETAGKLSVMGALSLYMNFINLFMHLLQLLSNRD